MAYLSIDQVQKLLSEDVFGYALDKKKAAGRALGTFVEIITYYLLKQWNIDPYTAIERRLPEYANAEITHNVEFTLHKGTCLGTQPLTDISRPTASALIKAFGLSDITVKNGNLLDANDVLKNAFTFADTADNFCNAYLQNDNVKVMQLAQQPIAMIECKRVGVEEGMKKGPQTIEKAKQGSYVARTVSSLQRFRHEDGRLMGVLPTAEGFIVDEYYTMLAKIIKGEVAVPRDFILTIGIVSNHGNWFTAENMNKELKVLASSFDWLVFLNDNGLVQFVNDLLLYPAEEYKAAREAFVAAYTKDKKAPFTKAKISKAADEALQRYFKQNIETISNNWFDVLSPANTTIDEMRESLIKLLQLNEA